MAPFNIQGGLVPSVNYVQTNPFQTPVPTARSINYQSIPSPGKTSNSQNSNNSGGHGRRDTLEYVSVQSNVASTPGGHNRMATDDFGGFVGFDENDEFVATGRQPQMGDSLEMLKRSNKLLREQVASFSKKTNSPES